MSPITRTNFDRAVSKLPCLRTLAKEIASFSWQDAASHGFLTGNPAPYNLVANGEIDANWQRPLGSTLADLLTWKYTANGFHGVTSRGLAFLFDPFVDAPLLIEATRPAPQFKDTTVLVLTDYSPLSIILGQLAICGASNWAEGEVTDFLDARNLGATGNNIFKALTGLNTIDAVRELGAQAICEAFRKHNLLIWNYFPFSRGGKDCTGKNGLPAMNDCRWLEKCDEFLCHFLNCVNASKVLFATNQDVKEARVRCAKLKSSAQLPTQEEGDGQKTEKCANLALAQSDLICGRPYKLLKHPSRWETPDCQIFSEALAAATSPPAVI